jgi:hypothetical protein
MVELTKEDIGCVGGGIARSSCWAAIVGAIQVVTSTSALGGVQAGISTGKAALDCARSLGDGGVGGDGDPSGMHWHALTA